MSARLKVFFFFTLFVAELCDAYAQGVRSTPYACTGRDCLGSGKLPISPFRPECTTVDDSVIVINKSENCGFGTDVAFSIGTKPKKPNHYLPTSLFTLDEIKSSIEGENPVLRVYYLIKGRYESCSGGPAGFYWGPHWSPLASSIHLDCDQGYAFPERNTPETVSVTLRQDQTIDESGYVDFDLSKCKSNLLVGYSSYQACKVELDLFEVQFVYQ